jgi:hypothetical protein
MSRKLRIIKVWDSPPILDALQKVSKYLNKLEFGEVAAYASFLSQTKLHKETYMHF